MTIRKLVSIINILNYFFGIIVCGMISLVILLGYEVHQQLTQDDSHCGEKWDEVSSSDFPVPSIPPIELYRCNCRDCLRILLY